MADPPINPNIRPPLGTFVTPGPHPSHGGNPYSDDMRQSVIAMWKNGDDLQSPFLKHLRGMKLFPHIVTCRRWISRFVEYDHVNPMRATGNHPSEREIQGQNLIQLAIFRSTNPKATTDETQAHLFNLKIQQISFHHSLPPKFYKLKVFLI